MDYLIGVDWAEIYQAVLDTLVMLGLSLLVSSLIGIPLGIVLYLSKHLWRFSLAYNVLSLLVNILRSIPFIILIIIMLPVAMLMVGTSLGALGAIPALVVAASAFVARLIENSLNAVDAGIIDMAKSCGANTWQIVWHVLVPEIMPNIVNIISVTGVTLVAYTAMAGAVGAGGLGDLAIRYGYQRFDTRIMLITVILLVVLVQLIQFIGDKLTNYYKKC